MASNGRKRSSKVTPNRSKRVPNWYQNVPTSPKMMPKGKSKVFGSIFPRLWGPLRHPFRIIFRWKTDKKPSGNRRLKSINHLWQGLWKNIPKLKPNLMKSLVFTATFHFSDFANSITYFCYFTTSSRSKTVDNFMEMHDRLPIVKNDENKLENYANRDQIWSQIQPKYGRWCHL